MTENYLGDCGMYQYIYCYADRFGNLSNPSPISETYYVDYFEYDDDGDDERKVDRIQLFNMALPDGLDKETKNNIEEFYIYRRNVRYSEGVDVGAFELVRVINIAKKPNAETDPNNQSINSWTDIDFIVEGDTPSYGNIAPIATDVIATSGVLIDVGAKTKDVMLWNFKYKCPINIPNNNATNYTNAPVIIEIDKEHLIDKDGNEPFNPNDYINEDSYLVNRDKLIFFDSDLTTPLNTICFDYDGDKIRCLITLPQFSSGEKIAYFCFTPLADFDDYEGIPDRYMNINNGIDYGAFYSSNLGTWSQQKSLVGEKVKNAHSIICSDFDFLKDGDVINKADMTHNGEMTDCTVVDSISKVPFLENYTPPYGSFSTSVGDKAVKFNSVLTANLKYDITSPPVPFPEKGALLFDIDMLISSVSGTKYWRILEIAVGGGHHIYLYYKYSSVGSFEIFFSIGGVAYNVGDNIWDSKLIMSWNLSEDKISFFQVGVENNYLYSSSEINTSSLSDISGNIDYIKFGRDDGENPNYGLPNNAIIDQFQMIGGIYLSADSSLNRSNAISMANFMPYFETRQMGYDFEEDTYNNHITFEEIEEVKYNNTNRVMWTPVNGLSFNLKNYKDVDEQCKRIIVAPYFLQDTYGNSAIIFTRNNIIRFLLSGTPDQWSLQTDNFITEYTQYGLLSKNSLGRFGESLFWHSEVGFMRWDRNGINLISKNRLNVPIKDSIVGFPVPLRNQYIFHDNTENKSWVYHIDTDVWTIFNGLDIDQVQILSGGSDDNNYNLLLTSTNTVNYYPTGDTTETTSVTTKSYPFDNIDFYRFRIDFEGDCSVNSTVTNVEGSVRQTFTDIDRMEWNYLSNGSWGENIRFTISDLDKLKKIEFDINRR